MSRVFVVAWIAVASIGCRPAPVEVRKTTATDLVNKGAMRFEYLTFGEQSPADDAVFVGYEGFGAAPFSDILGHPITLADLSLYIRRSVAKRKHASIAAVVPVPYTGIKLDVLESCISDIQHAAKLAGADASELRITVTLEPAPPLPFGGMGGTREENVPAAVPAAH